MRTIVAGVTAIAILFVCGCGGPQPSGPRDAGVTARAFVGDAELVVRYRYEPKGTDQLVLYVDAVSQRGDVGAIGVIVKLTGFEPLEGELSWQGNVSVDQPLSRTLTLKAVAESPSVDVVTRHRQRGVELASDTIRFVVAEEAVRECRPTDEACT